MDVAFADIFDNLTISSLDVTSNLYVNSTLVLSANVSSVLMRNQQYILWRLNEKLYFSKFLPATIYIGVCAVLGAAGNGIVVCVYNSKRKRNTANLFIFSLGVVDLLLCTTVMPFKLFDMRYPLMYGLTAVCKCYHFVEIALSMVAVTLMICIAVVRYLIIAQPLNKMTLSKVYKIIAVCMLIGIAASWPTIFIYGESSVKTSVPGIVGSTCGVGDHMKGKTVTQAWYIYLYAVFVITLVVLICMYTRIWMMIHRWKNTLIGESSRAFNPRYRPISKLWNDPIPFGDDDDKYIQMKSFLQLNGPGRPRKLSFDDDVICLETGELQESSSGSGTTESRENTNTDTIVFSKLFRVLPRNYSRTSAGAVSVESMGKKRARMRRNTLVFGVISLLFVLSYLPCLVVITLRTLHLYNVTKTSKISAIVAEVFIRSGYLSSVVNPYVYSFLCPNFRKGVYNLFFKIVKE